MTISEYAKRLPSAHRGTYLRAMGGNSKAAAIKAMCQSCMGHSDVAKRVAECSAEVLCPLWKYRPYQKRK